MKRRHVAFWIALAMLAVPGAPGPSADTLEDVELYYASRMRYENLNNYEDLQDHSGTEGNDRASFWSMRNQIGFGAKVADGVRFDIEIQNLGSFGGIDPRRSAFDAISQNTPSSGATTFGEEKSDTSVYRAIISLHEIGGSPVSLDVGRQEFVLTDGLILGNEPFYGGITFDGVNGRYAGDAWEAGVLWFKTQELNDPGSQFFFQTGGSDDQDIYGGYGRFRFGSEEGRHTLEAYALHRIDGEEASLHGRDTTVGAGWYRDVRTPAQAQANPMAWKAELAYQVGEVDFLTDPNTPVDLSAWILEAWFGWAFAPGASLHMPYGGVFMIPGEEDVTGDDVTFFRPLFPTNHGRVGETDFIISGLLALPVGVNAYHTGYRVASGNGRHSGRLAYWMLETAEDEIDLGTTTFELGDIGDEVNLLYDYAYRENVHLFLTLAQLSPDDDIAMAIAAGEDDPVTRIYGGFLLHSR